MRKILSILFVFLAVLSQQISTLIPHHHHGSAVCMIMDKCPGDDHLNFHHEHSGSSGNDEGDYGCVTRANFVAPQTDKSLNLKSFIQNDLHQADLPVFVLFFHSFLLPEPSVITSSDCDNYLFPHLAEGASCPSGLRAPPALNI